jgi:negative regulator of the PHO system
MMTGVPLFRGRDNQDQLLHIMRVLGTPEDRVLRKLAHDSVSRKLKELPSLGPLMLIALQPEIVLKQYPRYPKIPFSQVIPKASPQGSSISESVSLVAQFECGLYSS